MERVVADRGTVGEINCVTCGDRKWVPYQVETIDGREEEAWELCEDCKPVPARILRGTNLYTERKGEIERVANNRYRVPSCSGNEVYEVFVGEGNEACSCPDFRYREESCKHVYAALIHKAESKGVEVRYGMVADISVDGDEHYYVYSYRHDGERWVRDELLAITGYSLTAERKVRRLRAEALGEVA